MKRPIAFISAVMLLLPSLAGAVSISPAIIELSGARGTSVASQVNVQNTGDQDQTYYLETIKFAARENSGAPLFISPSVDRSGLPEWIALSKTRVTVKARSKATVPFTVAVPSDVPSGSENAAIVISDTPFDIVASDGAILQTRAAVLVLFTVTGETVAKAGLLDFRTVFGGDTGPYSGEAAYRFRVQNQGNVYLAPIGTVTLTDAFGRVVGRVDVNAEGGRVLPGMTRSYEGRFRLTAFAIGPITAVLKVNYADDAGVLLASDSFFILPARPLALAIIVLVGLVIALLVVARAKRST